MKVASPNQRSDQPVASPRRMSRCRIFWTLVLPTVLFAGALFQYAELPDYYAAIDSVTGIDPTTDLASRPTLLYPEFNLTFRVSSHTLWFNKCVEPGMYVGLAYGGVWFATTVPMTERICVGPRKTVDLPFVARGREVVMPVSVQDSLMGELSGGLPDFDVVLLGLEQCWALSCGRRRVGDTGVLQMRCSNYIRTSSRRYAN